LYGVDCSETKQKYGKQARQFTSRHAMEKTVRIEEKGSSYNRVVGIVYIKSLCLNSELLKSGYAWYVPKYCRASFCQSWKSIELAAKRTSAGLWSDLDPVPRGILDRKHPSKIMADVFVEILPAKNFIIKAVNILTAGIVQLFLKPQ